MKVQLIGFNIQEDVFPLGLSLLKAYAGKFYPELDIAIKEFSYGNRFGYDVNKNIEQQALSYIFLNKPNVVCFSCYIWNIELIVKLCQVIKKINPEITTVLGGSEVNDQVLFSGVDYIIENEGEVGFKELLDFFHNKKKISEVHNVVHLVNGKICHNENLAINNLDEIPIPYGLTNKKEYNAVRLETSRGCPFDCKYCYYAKVDSKKYSETYVKKSLDYIFDNLKFYNLTIIDANLNANKENMIKYLDYIESLTENKRKKVSVFFELKPELIDEKIVEKLKNYTFNIRVELGLQSVDGDVLKNCGRVHDTNKIRDNLKLLNDNGINYKIDMMYGLPDDDFFKSLQTMRFILNNAIYQNNVFAHHFMVLNNTEYNDDKSITRFDETYSSMVVKTQKQDVVDFYKMGLFVNMINEELKLYQSEK